MTSFLALVEAYGRAERDVHTGPRGRHHALFISRRDAAKAALVAALADCNAALVARVAALEAAIRAMLDPPNGSVQECKAFMAAQRVLDETTEGT